MGNKVGRPKTYPDGYVRKRGNTATSKMTRQEAAELYKGTPVIQLDYETGEYIGDYPSISAFALDNDIPIATVMGAFNRDNCCFVKLPKYQLLLMKKSYYDNMINKF